MMRLDEEDREDLLCTAKVLKESLPQDRAKLERVLAEEDFLQIAFMAHSIKGFAGHFSEDGALVETGTQLETACEAGDMERVRRAAAVFLSRLEVVAEAVDALLNDERQMV